MFHLQLEDSRMIVGSTFIVQQDMRICFADSGHKIFAKSMTYVSRTYATTECNEEISLSFLYLDGTRIRNPASAWVGSELVGWWMVSTGYIYIPVIFGRWQRDQITDTICLTPIGDSHCSAGAPRRLQSTGGFTVSKI